MARGTEKKRIWRRLLGLAATLMALSVLLVPAGPAGAVPAAGEQTAQAARVSAPPRIKHTARRAVPQPILPEEPPAAVVPETEEPVEDTYFSDVVFLGDSRTEGFFLYSGLKEGDYLFAVGATVESVFTKATEPGDRGKVPMLDALTELDCGKVYVMLGANELGWPRAEQFKEQYGKVIDRIREDHPDTMVVIQSILPVSALQEAKKSYVNNGRIAEFNQLLEELAVEKACPYLNIAEAVTDETGCLRAEWTFDGVHLNPAGCKAWLDYLRTHPVGLEAP
jgi:hypothetical protein